jgi:hypothetical protein
MTRGRALLDRRLVSGLAMGLGLVTAGCRPAAAPPDQATATTSTSPVTSASGEASATTPVPPSTSATTAGSTAADSTASPGTDSSSTGAPGCTKHVVLMGYWPPTNEMLRPWSQSPAQNPGGWIGQGWGGHGYDVLAFFPEFPPDGDPSNDAIGDDGAVGSPRHDLRVDYQATSADFWRIVDTYRPVILVTTSRGGGIGWEVEAIEGGHGLGNPGSPAFDWASDQHGAQTHPTEASIEPASWAAISTYRQGNTLPTRLPVAAIVEATSALGLTTVAIDETGTSGNFLSGFLGLHGLYYAQQAPHVVVAAGHIHVGYGLPVADASALIEATLHAVLQAHPADQVPCP